MGQVGGRDAFAGVRDGEQETLPSPFGRGAGDEGSVLVSARSQDGDDSTRGGVTQGVADQVG